MMCRVNRGGRPGSRAKARGEKKTPRKLLQWSRQKKRECELSRKWLGGRELQFMKRFGNRIHTPTTDVVLNLSGMKDSVSVNQDGLTKRAGCKPIISLWQVEEGRTQPFNSFLCIPTLPHSIKSEFQATVSTSWGSIREEACGLTYLALGTACPWTAHTLFFHFCKHVVGLCGQGPKPASVARQAWSPPLFGTHSPRCCSPTMTNHRAGWIWHRISSLI